ncbi:developmental regulator FlbA [Talaromyces proteolyticus]|uniref:Developmental regulator FlbA n=1 Tax=Talaromyces proteolyticus TaxID=1131652 RepID=A0AAD4KHJ5_9EURO|nr:developmental regulator FlbA [Talaromyces proteolyticus]KAH8691367.1 developmental regulator FlbA [Talaromyces proteolyticus]
MTTISVGNAQLAPFPADLPAESTTSTPPQTHTTTPTTSPTPLSSRASRRSLALLAIEKTSSAIASLASRNNNTPTPSLSGALSKGKYTQLANDHVRLSSDNPVQINPRAPPALLKRRNTVRLVPTSIALDSENPAIAYANKMHQTSSRLLRMTEDERPFTKDFNDLFSTLMVSLKLDTHRVRFSKFEHTFTSDEAINNLGSLKFSQSNRMPDPKDPSRIVTTTTTTTFSMAKEMARSVCQRFVDARFIEALDGGRGASYFPMKGGLYQLTPKGINILQRFCQRNGITARHVMEVLESPRNTMQLVNLERDPETDKLSADRATIEVIFRRFAGQDGPNVKSSVSSSDSDSLSDYSNGLVGVKMAKERRIGDKTYSNTFTGKATVDWLMDCSTTNDRRETCLIAALFIKHGLITSVQEDRVLAQQDPTAVDFQPTKYAIYTITEHGQRTCGWIARDRSAVSQYDSRGARDSNNARLNHILHDAALRLLFREFLRYSLCEENLSFYMDVSEFTTNYHRLEKDGAFNKIDTVRETLAAAYGLYNAFLAPGSPCELNIEHGLRNSLASRMTKAVGNDESMLKSLQEVVNLFELAQTSVFKLMSSDSVPKFVRDPKYSVVLQEHDFDLGQNGRSYSPTPAPLPERSASRSVRT